MKTIRTYNHTSATDRVLLSLLVVFLMFAVPSAYAQMIQIVSPTNGTLSDLHSQGVTAKGWAGFEVELAVNNQSVKKGVVRQDGIIDFINVSVPSGDVKYEARILNPDGSVLESDSVHIHVLGEPTVIRMEVADEQLRANGTSTTKGRIQVLDTWGYPFKDGIIVTVFADSGTILTKDIDTEKLGTQIYLSNSVAEFEYQVGRSTGVATISAQAEQAKGSIQIKLDMPLEPLTVVGLVNGGAAAMSSSGDRSRLSSDNSFTKGLTADGRMAVYARGTIGDDYLVTGSYDSDRRNRNTLFRDLDPDYLYSMYGDNSMLYYDVQTQSPLFVKVEKNRSYALIGDYNSDLSGQEFTNYSRSLNGVKVAHEDANWKIKAFGSLTDRHVKHEEIRGEGLSGYYHLSSTQITTGSEQVHIETRDKYHSETVLSTQDKYRFADYDIDYEQGTLFFKQPIPAIDADGNPVWIVITYEAMTDGMTSYVAGASAQRVIMDGLTVGLTGVTEEQSPKNYSLFGTNANYQFGGKFGINGEWAHSSDFASTPSQKSSGDAYKLEATGSPVSGLTMHGYYRRMEDGFYNIRESGSRKERGTIKYGLGGAYKVSSATDVNADFYQSLQELTLGQSTLTSLAGEATHRFDQRLSAKLRVENLDYETPDTIVGTRKQQSTLATAGASYIVGEKLKVTAQHERNLGSSQDVTRPNATALSADYKLTQDISMSAEERFYEGGGNLATVSLMSTVTEGTQAYGKYEIGNTAGARRNMISIGLRNKIKLPYDLTANMMYERAKDLSQRVDQTPTGDHTAYSAGLEYLPKEPMKASTKIEFGTDNTSKKMNFTFAGDYGFRKDLSAILKYIVSEDNAVSNSNFRNMYHLIAGLAYRPVENNDLNILGKFEIKGDNNHYVAPVDDYRAMIASVHTYLEPVRRFELGIKLAYKVSSEVSDLFSTTTHSSFYLFRGGYDLTEKFDVAAEYRALLQTEANDILYGYSLEVGYAVATNLRLVTGYNFKGYKDRDFVDNNLWSAGPFVKMSFKFGEDLFSK